MSWFKGDLPRYIPCVRKQRQAPFAREYPVEMWAYQSLLLDYGEGVRDWVKTACNEEQRTLAMHFFIPGLKLERLWLQQRHLWHKAWREIAPLIKFSVYPEFDAGYYVPLFEGRRLQYYTMKLGEDLHDADIPLIWLLLELKAGGDTDLDFYADYANAHDMRWVATNMQWAWGWGKQVVIEVLEVMAGYHKRLKPHIGVLVNGPSTDARIRAVMRVFEGREVVFSNSARIEVKRRGFI